MTTHLEYQATVRAGAAKIEGQLGPRLFRVATSHQLDPDQKAATTHLAHRRDGGPLGTKQSERQLAQVGRVLVAPDR
jgi:hypothetical protein